VLTWPRVVTSLKEALPDLNRIIQRDVQMEPGASLILEDTVAKPTDPTVKRSHFNVAVYQTEVSYWMAAHRYTSDEFEVFVRQPRYSVALTGFVTKMKWENKPRLELTDEVLRAAAVQIQIVLIGAFDGEGFILWHRRCT
jgi:hypothetical protein